MDESFDRAKARHRDARLEAYEATLDDLGLGAELRLTDIDSRAIAAWEKTWARRTHESGAGGWDWPKLVERQPRRAAILPLAIWYGDDLCGLALGRASRHRTAGIRHTVTLTHAERRPEPPPVPLRGLIIPLAAAVGQNYGSALGATRLRLEYPDAKLLQYYQLLGFEVAWKGGKPVYCEREIR